MIKLTKFESDLIRLRWIGSRFSNMFNEYRYAKPPKQFAYSFASVLREYAIVQLANFIDARDSLMGELRQMNKLEIDKVLSNQWNPIYAHRQALFKIRNAYIAHIQNKGKPFEITMEEISEKYQFPNVKGDLLYLIAMAMQYHDFIAMYFKNEYKNIEKKLNALRPHKTIIGIFSDKTAKEKADKTYLNTKKELEKKNLI